MLTESLLHQSVVCEGNALLPHPAMATLVDELTHRLQVGVSENFKVRNQINLQQCGRYDLSGTKTPAISQIYTHICQIHSSGLTMTPTGLSKKKR